MQDLKDEEVMLEYQKGEVSAMDELLRRYKNPIYHFIFRLTGNSTEAEDIAQEVFLRIHEHKDNYRPTGKFSTWIFSIAHNLSISRFRKLKWLMFWPRQNDDPEALVDFESPDPSPQEEVAANEMNEVVKNSIQGLPFLQREALILCEYEKMNYEDIARILKKSPGTVKMLIYRARQNLKIRLLPIVKEFKGGLR
ncbi:MAG: RNA polymerase sigma factor [Candidatus Omnitrophica bacterium]|nr:RNA polymerase sigma factor [Candidatus Omnitrophota bacterium]